MLIAVGSLAAMGAALGAVLGVASHYLAVEHDPLEKDLLDLLPGSQCGQCGYVGCAQAATALAKREAAVTICRPGGKATAEKLAQRLGISADLSDHEDAEPHVAFIKTDLCIGCLRCVQQCATDAIVGAPKQLHTVFDENCHGCGKCSAACPTEAIVLNKVQPTLNDWHWRKPAHAHPHLHPRKRDAASESGRSGKRKFIRLRREDRAAASESRRVGAPDA